MKSGVHVKDRMAQALKAIEGMTKQDVLIGIPSESAGRKEKGEPMDNATLGYIHEFGSPAANIPARPFLIPGVKEAQSKAVKHMENAAKAGLSNKTEEMTRHMSAAGMTAQNVVRAKINSGIAPALKPSTLKSRQRRGRTGDVPLIDTGQLRNAVTYVVRKKK